MLFAKRSKSIARKRAPAGARACLTASGSGFVSFSSLPLFRCRKFVSPQRRAAKIVFVELSGTGLETHAQQGLDGYSPRLP